MRAKFKLGSTAFARVRIGTGGKPDYMQLADYVLSRIPQAENATMTAVYGIACDFVETWLGGKPWQDMTVTASA